MPLTKKMQGLVDTISGYRQALLDEVSGLSESQFDYQPEGDGWSIGTILHHLALTEEANMKLTYRALKRARERNIHDDPTPDESALGGLDGFADILRTARAEAPAFVVPQSHLSPNESIEKLKAAREKMTEPIEGLNGLDLTELKYAHPLLGDLDMYQWLLIAGAHERRHTAQIGRIKSESGFPKS